MNKKDIQEITFRVESQILEYLTTQNDERKAEILLSIPQDMLLIRLNLEVLI
jgi:hypothetical protein